MNTTTHTLKGEGQEIKFEQITQYQTKVTFFSAKYIGDTFYPSLVEIMTTTKARFVWKCWTDRGYVAA